MTKNKPKVLRVTCEHSGGGKLRVHLSDKDYDALQERIGELEARCAALVVGAKNDERQVKNLEAAIDRMQGQIDSDYQKLLSKDAHASGLTHRNKKLEEECERLRGELYTRVGQVSSLQAKLDAYEARNAELENTLKRGPAELAAAYESLKHAMHKRGETVVELQAKNAELEQRMAYLQSDAVARANRYNDYRRQVSQGQNKAAEVWARRADQAMSRAVVAQDRLDLLVSMLGGLFGWQDTSYLHAVMHVENAVNNLKADAGVRRWEENKEKKNE